MVFLPFFGGSCPLDILVASQMWKRYDWSKTTRRIIMLWRETTKWRQNGKYIKSNYIRLCKLLQIEKSSLFIHFGPKSTHINGCKIVHLCTIATVRAYMHGYCSISIYYFIFFSLSSLIWSLSSSAFLILLSSLKSNNKL